VLALVSALGTGTEPQQSWEPVCPYADTALERGYCISEVTNTPLGVESVSPLPRAAEPKHQTKESGM